MEPIEEAGRSYQQMAIVEKYEKVIHYLYPIAQPALLGRFLAAWIGHAKWADTHHLMRWLEGRYAITC